MVLTLIEMTALAIVIGVGFYVMAQGDGDLGRVVVFESGSDAGMFLAVTVATAIAFFAMVGFEDSVNMVEEAKEPERIFPQMMLTGLGIAVVIYMLVAISVIAVIPEGEIESVVNDEGKVLLEVVSAGAPDFPIDKVFPFLTVFAVANTALINMLMASRLLYGMAKQDVLPRSLGKVLPGRRTPWAGIVFSTLLALGLIVVRHLRWPRRGRSGAVRHHRAAAALRVLRRQHRLPGAAPRPDAQRRLPGADRAPALGAVCLPVPGRAVGARPRGLDPVQDRRRPARDRRRAVGADLADQPRGPREEDRLPRHRAPRGLTRRADARPVRTGAWPA